jgi:hypothetical protein
VTQTTVTESGALTVAGQWRTFTAFPSILARNVVSHTMLQRSRDDIERLSMSSTFIATIGSKVKKAQKQESW